MRAKEFLFESRGIGARKPGEEFVAINDPTQKIYIDSIQFYPESGGKYSDEEFATVLKNVEEEFRSKGILLSQVKQFNKTDRAFGIAVFNTASGNSIGFIKPFKQVSADPTANNWDNQQGIPGYKYNSKSAAKTQAGLTPQDILTTLSDLTPEDIIKQISEKFGQSSPLTLLASNIASGVQFPIEIAAIPDMSFTAFRDYFCELLHPIALHSNSYTGNAGKAAEKFLGSDTFDTTLISFGSDKTEGLSDSILISPQGLKIKVSSKGAGGAQASSKNLLDAANEIKNSDPKLYKKYEKTIKLIEEIKSAGQSLAPLKLGVKYNIISNDDAEKILQFKSMPLAPLETVETMKISKTLKKLIKERDTVDQSKVNFYYHSIAAVAHKVAAYINENTDFSSTASSILNNGALIQVYTSASEKGNKWIIKSFNTVWPSSTVSGVKFSASKTYYSTGIKGNFTFKILKNGAIDHNDDENELLSPPMTNDIVPTNDIDLNTPRKKR